jgi:hypothetical protein
MKTLSKMRASVIVAGATLAAGTIFIASPAYADGNDNPGGCSTQVLGTVPSEPGQVTSGTLGGAFPPDTPNGGVGVGVGPTGQNNVSVCINGNWVQVGQTAPPPSVVKTFNTAVAPILSALLRTLPPLTPSTPATPTPTVIP